MLKGLGQLGDMAKLMKQAQEIQSKVAEAQDALEAITVEGVAGGGLVRVSVTAKGAVQSVSIDPSLLSPENKEVVEDLVTAALRDGQERASARAQEEMAQATAGFNLPEGMKLPF